MKTESEFGFEPSLVIEMERVSQNRQEVEALKNELKKSFKPKIGSKSIHFAHILKDRTDTINGQSYKNLTYKDFLPHIKNLNLGGTQLGIDNNRNSEELFDAQGDTQWKKRKQ